MLSIYYIPIWALWVLKMSAGILFLIVLDAPGRSIRSPISTQVDFCVSDMCNIATFEGKCCTSNLKIVCGFLLLAIKVDA